MYALCLEFFNLIQTVASLVIYYELSNPCEQHMIISENKKLLLASAHVQCITKLDLTANYRK